MILKRMICLFGALTAGALLMPELFAQSGPGGGPAVKKPVELEPESYRELVRDPAFKNARPLLNDAPLGTSDPLDRWNEHKRAMHLKSLKRSGLDHPDLKREVDLLISATAPDPNESEFEKVGDLKIFRFTNFDKFIKNTPEAKRKAIALGKAMFWDVRFSSDQKVACATCHYAAGSDHRTASTVTMPVNFGVHFPWPDINSAKTGYTPYRLSGQDLASGSNELVEGLARGVFDPNSLIGFKTREVIGSQGIEHRRFLGNDGAREKSEKIEFKAAGYSPEETRLFKRIAELEGEYRQVTQRNAGTVINSVFNSRNFHDSRASFIFNGRTSWGQHDNPAVNDALFVWRSEGGPLIKTTTWNRFQADGITPNPHYIANASLASQAVEPVISDVEMSYQGRMFHHIADRMLDMPILEGQEIGENDSSLEEFRAARPTYRALIQEVFTDEWWKSSQTIELPADGLNVVPEGYATATVVGGTPIPSNLKPYDLTEANFSLFWGLAIHIYESTLISDQTPFDREVRATMAAARAKDNDFKSVDSNFNEAQRRGLKIFREVGCGECHAGAEFTAASFAEIGLLRTRPEAEEPVVINEDEDIVAGELKCPDNKPLGVECMNQRGRMHSVYDGGNYVLGVSRFVRKPSLPDSPRVPRASVGLVDPLTAMLFDNASQAAFEDSGNGNDFVPSELNYDKTLSEWQRLRFQEYFNAVPTRLAVLNASLQRPGTAMMDGASSLQATAANLQSKPLPRGRALNYTQQVDESKSEQPPMRSQLMNELKRSRNAVAAPASSPILSDEQLRALGLVSVKVNGVAVWTVTPAVKSPQHSLARRFLPDWKASVSSGQQPKLAERIADGGAFRVPTLRNIELTGPYMHNGSLLTLDAVVEFYSRGGDYNARVSANEEDIKTGDKHPEMEPLNLSSEQKSDLVAFLKALTDTRVRDSQAPFDHPSLPLIVGVQYDQQGKAKMGSDGRIEYRVTTLPASVKTEQGVPVKPTLSFEQTLLLERGY